MALPWAAAIAAEWAGIRRAFASDLAGRGVASGTAAERLPRLPVAVLAATLAGLAASSPLGIEPAWPVAARALALLAAQRVRPAEALRAADPALLAFVLGLALIVLNNLPALLVLLPAAAAAGPATVLAVLIGVNVGPNLTYTGSLATLLWRRVLHERDAEVELGEFLRLGALTVPAGLAGATVALWLAWQVLG